MSRAKERNLLIVKLVFVALVVLNILSSVWVILHDRAKVKQAENEYGENWDWYTGEKGPGYYAKYWFIACIIIMVVNDLLSLGALYGVYIESSEVVMCYSALMFVMAVYGAWDKYMKDSYTSFLLPLATGILGMLYASLNHMRLFEGSTLPDTGVHYITKSKQPSTPTPHAYADDDEEEKLKLPDV